MDLEAYLSSHPTLSVLTPDDEVPALELCSQNPMRLGGIELTYDRSPDFQAILRCQSPDFLTIVSKKRNQEVAPNSESASRDPENSLRLVFSISQNVKWLNGRRVKCGYIGDFRTDRSRAAAKIWREYYVEFLRAWKSQASPPQYILTAILKKNLDAFRNLVSPKRELGFRYVPLCDLDMVNVYGRLPWAKKPWVETRYATEGDTTALLEFLARREKDKVFGSLFDESSESEWSHRSLNWQGFSIENFLLQKDATGRIIACTLPWDAGFAKRMRVTKAPPKLRWVFRILNFLGYRLPAEGDSLKTLYLTHLNFSPELDPAISLNSILCFLHRQKLDYHMISFADPHRWCRRINGWITQKIPVSLFSVGFSGDARVHLTEEQTIGFEIGLV